MNVFEEASINNCEDYQRIAQAITFLRENYRTQPDLATVAKQVHLSESHFQRLFTQWAGVSPKRFLQYLSVEYAKSRIAETKNLLDLTSEVGLSSPGRLHDLFVTIEGMSPGEFRTKGTGLQITYGVYGSPFGKCLIATTFRGICNLYFLEDRGDRIGEEMLRQVWQNATLIPDPDAIEAIGNRIFDPTQLSRGQPLVLWVKGTNFQLQVWRALLNIPQGRLMTYQGLAQAIDRPRAARAVGNALNRNPISYLIPCHRVIRESGELGGYRWGLDRKRVILAWEASQTNRLSDP